MLYFINAFDKCVDKCVNKCNDHYSNVLFTKAMTISCERIESGLKANIFYNVRTILFPCFKTEEIEMTLQKVIVYFKCNERYSNITI